MFQKYIFIIILFFSTFAQAQLKNISGLVTANGEVEGIHVLNKSSVKYTITDTDGSFTIPVKLNDTLVFSALKYQIKEVVISQKDISSNNLRVKLEEKINELDEVTVGKVLTGNLGSDLKNTPVETPINFYDLGIPGYKGKPKTIEERKLADADAGSWGYVGIGFGVNFHKLLNRISGRTKKLKEIVEISENDKCMKRLKSFYSESLFENEVLSEAQQNEYFYFCMDEENFNEICDRNDPIEVIPFLKQKLKAYKANLNSNKN